MAIELTTADVETRQNIRALLDLDIYQKDNNSNVIFAGSSNTVNPASELSTLINTISSDVNGLGCLVIGGGVNQINNASESSTINSTFSNILTAASCYINGGVRHEIISANTSLIYGGSASKIESAGISTILNSSLCNISYSVFSGIYNSGRSNINTANNGSILHSDSVSLVNATNSHIDHSTLGFIYNSPWSSMSLSTSAAISEGWYNQCSRCENVSIEDAQNVVIKNSSDINATVCLNVDVTNTITATITGVQDTQIAGKGLRVYNTTNSLIAAGSGHQILNGRFVNILGGKDNASSYSNTFLLGSSLTATQVDTTYTENIINKNVIKTKTVQLIAPNNDVYSVSVTNSGVLSAVYHKI